MNYGLLSGTPDACGRVPWQCHGSVRGTNFTKLRLRNRPFSLATLVEREVSAAFISGSIVEIPDVISIQNHDSNTRILHNF